MFPHLTVNKRRIPSTHVTSETIVTSETNIWMNVPRIFSEDTLVGWKSSYPFLSLESHALQLIIHSILWSFVQYGWKLVSDVTAPGVDGNSNILCLLFHIIKRNWSLLCYLIILVGILCEYIVTTLVGNGFQTWGAPVWSKMGMIALIPMMWCKLLKTGQMCLLRP